MALLVIAVIVLLLVVGMWLRNVMLGGVPPVMATVTVKQGDTLWSLAEQYGDPNQYILERVNALVQANGLERSQALRAGQTLVIPVTNRSARLYYGGQYASREIAE
jgi:LysM repeat protein